MCEEYKCINMMYFIGKLLSKIPLDPKMQALIDQGKNIFVDLEGSPAVEEYQRIAKCIHYSYFSLIG